MSTPIITANFGRFDKQTSRLVIFNADDFGLSKNTNAGIIACHGRGVVRSTSVLAGGGAFEEAAGYARGTPSLDSGLHLALCEVAPVSDPAEIPSLVARDGNFLPGFATFLRHYAGGGVRKEEIEKEFRAQLEKTLRAGLKISHLDSHQHLHALPAIFEIVVRLAAEYHIPAVRCPDERGARISLTGRALQRIGLSAACRLARRSLTRPGVATTDHFSGFMDMGRWNEASLRARIKSLPPGLTEICCHPRDEPGTIPGCNFREEMAALTSEGVKQFLEQEKVQVTSFRESFTTPPPDVPPAI
jgi:predicted glycoside hydrolase/deacetylase ChbG (UPF0249 family)